MYVGTEVEYTLYISQCQTLNEFAMNLFQFRHPFPAATAHHDQMGTENRPVN